MRYISHPSRKIKCDARFDPTKNLKDFLYGSIIMHGREKRKTRMRSAFFRKHKTRAGRPVFQPPARRRKTLLEKRRILIYY